LTLLRVGFTKPPRSPWALVVSYTTVSPLPPVSQGRSVFCGTFPRVTPGRRYRPPCPAEPGPSSARQADLARRDRPASSPAARVQRRGRTAALATGRNLPGISAHGHRRLRPLWEIRAARASPIYHSGAGRMPLPGQFVAYVSRPAAWFRAPRRAAPRRTAPSGQADRPAGPALRPEHAKGGRSQLSPATARPRCGELRSVTGSGCPAGCRSSRRCSSAEPRA
jgi:hypothetical protein